MKDSHPERDGFTQLWPTLFLRRHLPGHEAANQALLQLIEDLEAQNRDLTTDYRDSNILALEHQAAGWLKDCVNKTAIDYLRRVGLEYPVNWTLQGWANVNRRRDYHHPHNHPHAYLSGTYYLRVPEQPDKRETRKDLRPGAISFYDPRGAVNMSATSCTRICRTSRASASPSTWCSSGRTPTCRGRTEESCCRISRPRASPCGPWAWPT
jgi:hypothetical protein